jgi:hypothetical protein
MCAFIYDVFPGLASLVRRFVDIVFVCLRMPGAGNTDACLRLRCVPGLGKPGATLRQHRLLPDVTTIFFAASRATTDYRPPVPLFPSRAALLTSLHPRLLGDYLDTGYPDSTSTTAFLARLPRLRLHHPTLSATSTSTQRATACLGTLLAFTPATNSAMRRPLRLWWGCPSASPSDSSPVSPSALLRCDCGGMLSIFDILGNMRYSRILFYLALYSK